MNFVNKKPKNLAASVKARLLNIARENQRDFNAVLLQYFQERFLYRLSQSSYKDNFVLKGALLFLIYEMPQLRTTKDIDFLGSGIANDLEKMKRIIQDIAQIPAKDAVIFQPDSVKLEKIAEVGEYQGVRIRLDGRLGSVRKKIQLDIVFGDVIVAGPVERNYPTLLDNPAPIIKIYSLESSTAEKFEAIVKYNFLSSRMKDFYDILYLARNHSFQFNTLYEAIEASFKNRQTSLIDRQVVFDQKFKNDPARQVQWNAFLNRNNLEAEKSFKKVIELLEDFLEPVCQQIEKQNIHKKWNVNSWSWRPV